MYHMYGDSIYPHSELIESESDDRAKNRAMSSLREGAEHHGENYLLRPFIHRMDKIKICAGMPLVELYFCQVFFRNIYTCMYYNKTSDRLKCYPPSFENYLLW